MPDQLLDSLPANILVTNFSEAIHKVSAQGAFPIVTVYNSPLDQPGKFVARLWATDVPTRYAAIGGLFGRSPQNTS